MSEKRTADDLVQLRVRMIAFHGEENIAPPQGGIVFTCDGCAAAPECEFVFDPYNTDGDCLAEK